MDRAIGPGANRDPDGTPLLSLSGVSKSFPGVQALRDVSFEVRPGAVHALLGANGAGKSTLIKILSGAQSRDAGQITFDGEPADWSGPQDAATRGIAVLYQEPALVPYLTVEQNIALGQERTGRWGMIRRGAQQAEVSDLLSRIAPAISPQSRVAELRTSERQLVALAKAMRRHPKLLMLDEPTASMTAPEIRALFSVIEDLRADGAAIMYITHRLGEVLEIAGRATVLRDGRHVRTAPVADFGRDGLVEAIAGRAVETPLRAARAAAISGAPILTVDNLSRAGVFRDISFRVHAGEVVALAGLVGSGRSEIARAILAADPHDSGTIRFPRGQRAAANPAQALVAGVAMVPEDRKGTGIVPKMSVSENIVLSSLSRCGGRVGLLDRGLVRQVVHDAVERMDIRPRGAEERMVETLSGGNQQKVVLSRAMESGAELLVLDEPTAGVDVGAKSEIHQLILGLASAGKGILLISSEMEEVMALADRILVIREGSMMREYTGHESSSFELIASALGESERRMEAADV